MKRRTPRPRFLTPPKPVGQTIVFRGLPGGETARNRPHFVTQTSVCAFLFLLAAPSPAAEQAAYDASGRITALLSNAEDIEIATNIVAILPTGKRIRLTSKEAHREESGRAWKQDFELPDGGSGTLNLKSEEDSTGLRYTTTLTAESNLEVAAIEFVVDLPHPALVKGNVTPDAAPPIPLSTIRPTSPILFQGNPAALHFTNAAANLQIDASFDKPTAASVVDRWDKDGRSYQLRAVLLKGPAYSGAKSTLTTTLRLTNHPPPPPPVHLTLSGAPRYTFDGFGGDYCWDTRSPAAKYTFENLKVAWARSEMKLLQWDKHRDPPTDDVRGDLEMMRRFQQRGVPFVISIWWLPERFYTDPYEKPKSAHNRLINPEKWDELLDLIGSYLLYAKSHYGVEPDLFSFNESNIGIYVGLTPETHLEAIKRIGAHFRKLGLKTKMVLGDATGPKDTHKFVLEAAADPEALQYVGAVAFHSWGGGTPEQYTAWGDVAEWLGLPLLVTELGVDAGAYHNRAYDSYHYGLEEARMTQELLRYARPQGAQFWQFTNDYALVRTSEKGAPEPTLRFWLMKHFTDLTPPHSQALTTTSDQPAILFTAFRKADAYTLHILNLGAERSAELTGLPNVQWRVIQTTEAAGYQTLAPQKSNHLTLPPKSLVSLTTP